jgi:hypothetical protein
MKTLRRLFLVTIVSAILTPASASAFGFLQLLGLKKKPTPAPPPKPWGQSKITKGSPSPTKGYNTTHAISSHK